MKWDSWHWRASHCVLAVWCLLVGAGTDRQAVAQVPPPHPPVGASPEINRDFLDPNLDVDRFVQRFELESREIFSGRREILRACQLQPGNRVADIGAGTGFFTKLFAVEVGESGWVYAVEISPRFVEHIRSQMDEAGLLNVSPILTNGRTAALPPRSVDMVFICDTYHHFEHPQETMKSLFEATAPGGSLVVIDFERTEGVSREWILSHVRAGKETFRAEIEAAGFEFVEEIRISAFAENYFLRFRRPASAAEGEIIH